MKPQQSQEDLIDVKETINKLAGKWYYYAISIVVLMLIAYIIVKSSPNVYSVVSALKMNTGTTKTEMILDAGGKNYPAPAKSIEDEILVIKSTEYIKEALNKLGFVVSYYSKDFLKKTERHRANFPFEVELDSSILQITGVPFEVKVLSDSEYELKVKGENIRLYNFEDGVYLDESIPAFDFNKKYKFGTPVKEDYFGFTIHLVRDPRMYGDDKLFFTVNSPDALVKVYFDKLQVVAADRNSSILILNSQGSIVQKEKDFLNTLMEVVKQKDLDEKNQEGVATINFIDYQLADVSQSLDKAERDLESFQYSTTSLGESGTLYAKRDQLETELADLNLKDNYLKNILNNLESVEGVSRVSGPSSVGINDPIMSSLLQKLTDLNQQRIQLGRTATEANPLVQRLDLEIRSTKDALRDKINGAINTTNIMISDANARIAQTNQMINRLPSTEIRRMGVQRKLSFSDNTYDLFLERKAAAAISLATNVSDWKIVENAKLQEDRPVSPNKKFIYLLAFFLSVVIPTVVILIIDFFDNSIKTKSDIERITSIPILGTVTKGDKHLKLVSEYDPRSHLLESLREIRINLQFLSHSSETKVIGVTSSTSGEGKTFCSVNIGAVLAQSGKRVLIIDADMRKSNMPSYFHFNNNAGLSTYLIGNSTVKEIIKHTKINNLHVVLSGPFPPNPFELLGNERFRDLIKEARDHYDYIIIDTPPLGLVADFLVISDMIEASIYVARHNYTKKSFFEKINDLHELGKIKNVSVVLNDVTPLTLYGDKIYKSNYYKGYFRKDAATLAKEAKEAHKEEVVE